MPTSSVLRSASLVVIAFALVGCGDGKPPAQAEGPPPAVTVIKVVAEDIRPSTSFTGRVEAIDKVELRARVDGFLEKRVFTEGADVKDGDLLFMIEKGLYQAAVEEANGALSRAQGALTLADLEVDRQTQLFERNVAAKATLDTATAKQAEARGAVLSAKASVDKAELQLSYTDIRAPTGGRIGRASVSVGNFVGPATGTLATIVSQDPIYVTFPVTQRELLDVRKRQGDIGKSATESVIYLQLADRSRYGKSGKVDFLDVSANAGTDTVLVRAAFPNPDRQLFDGQLVNVIAEAGLAEHALLVPQQALQADQAGLFALVVDGDNKVQVRRVETGPIQGSRVVVRKGLNAGERVITEGVQKVRPGQTVQATEIKPEA